MFCSDLLSIFASLRRLSAARIAYEVATRRAPVIAGLDAPDAGVAPRSEDLDSGIELSYPICLKCTVVENRQTVLSQHRVAAHLPPTLPGLRGQSVPSEGISKASHECCRPLAGDEGRMKRQCCVRNSKTEASLELHGRASFIEM